MTELIPHLGKAEGRIHLAGKHASAYHGWIQSAIESGNRAAKEVNSL
jgi:monoamine oxidase